MGNSEIISENKKERSLEALLAYSFGVCGIIANGLGFLTTFFVNADIAKSTLWYILTIVPGIAFAFNLVYFLVVTVKLKKYSTYIYTLILINGFFLFPLELYGNGYSFFNYYYILAVYCGTCVTRKSQYVTFPLMIVLAAAIFVNAPVKNSGNLIIDTTDKWKLTIEPTIVFATIFIITVNIYSKIRRDTNRLLQQEVELKRLAERDILTSAFVRRVLEKDLEEKDIKVVVMIDIDNFKHVNDTYGHTVGDKVLVSLADQFYHYRCYDFQLYRYGGEEFCVLSCYSLAKTVLIMRSIYASIRKNLKAENEPITISAGIASNSSDARQALKAADDYLYKAKKNGKNKACVNDKFMFEVQ